VDGARAEKGVLFDWYLNQLALGEPRVFLYNPRERVAEINKFDGIAFGAMCAYKVAGWRGFLAC